MVKIKFATTVHPFDYKIITKINFTFKDSTLWMFMSISYLLNGKVQNQPLLDSSKNQSHTVSETVIIISFRKTEYVRRLNHIYHKNEVNSFS